MIAEWARLVREEAEQGIAQPDADRVLVWERTGGIAGFCDQVVIGRTGGASTYDCSTGSSKIVSRLTLQPDELAELYTWMDRHEPFYWESDTNGAVADAMDVTIDFKGAGVEPLTAARASELLVFVDRIVNRLMTTKAEN